MQRDIDHLSGSGGWLPRLCAWEAGAAFLGSQGDVWDAQKDILCDTIGAICSSGLFLWCDRRE